MASSREQTNVTSTRVKTNKISSREHGNVTSLGVPPNEISPREHTSLTSTIVKTKKKSSREQTNVTSPKVPTHRISSREDTNATSPRDKTKNMSPIEHTNVTSPILQTNIKLPREQTNMTSPRIQTNKVSQREPTKVTSLRIQANQITARERTNVTSLGVPPNEISPREHTSLTSTIVKTKKKSSREQTNVTSPKVPTHRISSREDTNATSPRDKTKNMSPIEHTNVTSPILQTNIKLPREQTNMTSPRIQTNKVSQREPTKVTSLRIQANQITARERTNVTSPRVQTNIKLPRELTNLTSRRMHTNTTLPKVPKESAGTKFKHKEKDGSVVERVKNIWKERRDKRFRKHHPFVPNMKEKEKEKIGNLNLVRCSLEETYRNKQWKIRKCHAGESMLNSFNKTIMMVGATGSGKSTLIDGMANYMFKADWKRHKRIKLVDLTEDEKKNAKLGQTVSQTEWITVYCVPNSAKTTTRYAINIIDTPGFGDTRGMQRDKHLIQQIKYLFENPQEFGIDMVNAICFVAPAPDVRLTETQKYIFSEIQSLFGKNVTDNIFVMVTFSDLSTPPVIKSIESMGIPYTASYKFQNSALFSPTDITDETEKKMMKMFWELGTKSFETFFGNLGRTTAKSLTLSAEVLQEREKLTNTVECLNINIQFQCQRLTRLHEEQNILEKHENKAKGNDDLQNKDFQYRINQEQLIKMKAPGRLCTNCSVCHVTCFKDSKANEISSLECLDASGSCTNCTDKCNAHKHSNEPFIYKLKIKKMTRTQRYERASLQMNWESIRHIQQELVEVKKEIIENIMEGTRCTKRLHQIALKPTEELSWEEFIDFVIDKEDRERELGWEQRIERLLEIRMENDK